MSAPHVIRPKLQPTPTTELGLGAPHSKKPLPAVGGSSFFSQMCRCFGWCEWESGGGGRCRHAPSGLGPVSPS